MEPVRHRAVPSVPQPYTNSTTQLDTTTRPCAGKQLMGILLSIFYSASMTHFAQLFKRVQRPLIFRGGLPGIRRIDQTNDTRSLMPYIAMRRDLTRSWTNKTYTLIGALSQSFSFSIIAIWPGANISTTSIVNLHIAFTSSGVGVSTS